MKIEQLKEWGYIDLYDLATLNYLTWKTENSGFIQSEEKREIKDFRWSSTKEGIVFWRNMLYIKTEEDLISFLSKSSGFSYLLEKKYNHSGVKIIKNGLLC